MFHRKSIDKMTAHLFCVVCLMDYFRTTVCHRCQVVEHILMSLQHLWIHLCVHQTHTLLWNKNWFSVPFLVKGTWCIFLSLYSAWGHISSALSQTALWVFLSCHSDAYIPRVKHLWCKVNGEAQIKPSTTGASRTDQDLKPLNTVVRTAQGRSTQRDYVTCSPKMRHMLKAAITHLLHTLQSCC